MKWKILPACVSHSVVGVGSAGIFLSACPRDPHSQAPVEEGPIDLPSVGWAFDGSISADGFLVTHRTAYALNKYLLPECGKKRQPLLVLTTQTGLQLSSLSPERKGESVLNRLLDGLRARTLAITPPGSLTSQMKTVEAQRGTCLPSLARDGRRSRTRAQASCPASINRTEITVKVNLLLHCCTSFPE